MSKNITQRTLQAIKTKFGKIEFYTQSMKIKDVLYIYYVAVRGQNTEEGAIQRVLNRSRINSVKDFVLKGNMFLNTFILNWTDKNYFPEYKNKEIIIPLIQSAAQVIDGQHRLAGLQEAVKEIEEIGEKEILVSLTIGLSTKEAALIFLNINSEQRPVPKSLIFDLYGEVEDDLDHAINRATDIAAELNENPESPYYGAIKYPGKPRGVGVIDLSSVISSLKKHLEKDGAFPYFNLQNLNNQKLVILNYFNALKSFYDTKNVWESKTANPFMTSAGFIGAIDALANTFLPRCADKKDFTENRFKEFLGLDKVGIILRDDIKQIEGRTRRKWIKEHLESNITTSLPDEEQYKFQ